MPPAFTPPPSPYSRLPALPLRHRRPHHQPGLRRRPQRPHLRSRRPFSCRHYFRDVWAAFTCTDFAERHVQLVVIGCGTPRLACSLAEDLGAFGHPALSIYTDPERSAYSALGLVYANQLRTVSAGNGEDSAAELNQVLVHLSVGRCEAERKTVCAREGDGEQAACARRPAAQRPRAGGAGHESCRPHLHHRHAHSRLVIDAPTTYTADGNRQSTRPPSARSTTRRWPGE